MKPTLRYERIQLNTMARPAPLKPLECRGRTQSTHGSFREALGILSVDEHGCTSGAIFDDSDSFAFCPSFSLLRVLGVDLKEGMGQEIAGNNRADLGIQRHTGLGRDR